VLNYQFEVFDEKGKVYNSFKLIIFHLLKIKKAIFD